MSRFSGHAEPWGSYLDVKNWPKISNPQKYNGTEITIGSVTDPYNPFERKFERTKRFLSELQGTTADITIITKSDLVLRDIDIIKAFPNIKIAFSINTLDENFKNDMDLAVGIERRLHAMKTFYDNKICTACFISPIFPGITDVHAIINAVLKQCNFIWLENLNLRGLYKTEILNYIKHKHPELVGVYHEIYVENNNRYWVDLADSIKSFCKSKELAYLNSTEKTNVRFPVPPIVVNYFYHEQIKKSAKKNSILKIDS